MRTGLTKISSIWQHHFIYYLKLTKINFQQRYSTMCRAHYTETKKSSFVLKTEKIAQRKKSRLWVRLAS